MHGRLWGQEVKDQGPRRPKLYLEAWRRHSWSFEWSRWSYATSDGNSALEKEGGVVAKVLWTLCYASPEEIPELQRPPETAGIFNVEMIP